MQIVESIPHAEQFESPEQQRQAATLGMWIFIATEVLLFGGLFLAYGVYRFLHPAAFRTASIHTIILAGSLNTAILLVSSFTMVLAVRASSLLQKKQTAWMLAATAALGLLFLVIKAIEYTVEIHEGFLPGEAFRFPHGELGPARIFFSLYFVMTGLHAIHVTIGVGLISFFLLRWALSNAPEHLITSIDLVGLYWHFVDVVWVFLFPLIYLVGRHR